MRALQALRWLAVALLVLPVLAAAPLPDAQARFATPEAAVEALVAAVRAKNPTQLRALFGQTGFQIVDAGDPVANQEQRQKFIAAYDSKHAIALTGDTATLSVGPDDWPFPIPLEHAAQGWWFNVPAGREEILARRIGANELFTQQAVLAYVDAQNEYVQSLHDGNRLHVYAQRILSSPGKQDGLYWPTAEGQPDSPLGPLVAEARTGGYRRGEGGAPQPFHGYYYRVLKGQGPHAPGGAYSYLAGGRMLGGFGLVAWPAHWGSTGVMTFIVNQDGELYQKDLGPQTADIAKTMAVFDPDPTWQKIGSPDPAGSQGDVD